MTIDPRKQVIRNSIN